MTNQLAIFLYVMGNIWILFCFDTYNELSLWIFGQVLESILLQILNKCIWIIVYYFNFYVFLNQYLILDCNIRNRMI